MAAPNDLTFLRQSIKRKIDRARTHANDLTNRSAALRRGEAYEVAREIQPDGVTEIFTFHELQPIPEDFPVVLSEFLHHSRSALDNMIYALWTKNRGKPPSSSERSALGFPIAETRGHFNPKQIAGVPTPSKADIKTMQPYNGSNPNRHPLATLSRLNNIDKHRHVHIGFWQFHSVGWFGEQPIGRWLSANEGRLIDGAEIARFRWTGKPNPEVDLNFTCEVVLSERPRPMNNLSDVTFDIFRHVLKARDMLLPPHFGY